MYPFSSLCLLRCIQGYARVCGDAGAIASDSGIALGEMQSSDEIDDLLGAFPRKVPPEPTKEDMQNMAGMQYI
jgi:hypothetical protein